ncbi:dolichyl-phosphate mannose synthase [Planctomycetota bacterium]|nr:dolichyl-phosphate mannose synthase [Planctomycetota bacterium]
MPELLAIVPAYNEATRIAPVIAVLVGLGLPVLVVDDGSHDDTAAAARAAGARVLRKPNGGKGSAILAGSAWAVDQGFRLALFIDGDGQHDPREALRLIAAAKMLDQRGREPFLVIGRRMLRIECQPLHRRFLNRLSSLTVTFFAGRRIIDSQSGFRLCDPALLLRLPLAGRRYDLESEVCVLAGRAGITVTEVPITVIYNDKVSGLHPVWDTLRFLKAAVFAWFRARPWLRRATVSLRPTDAAADRAGIGQPALG